MSAPRSSTQSRFIAGFVSIAGVVGIWAWSASRQSDTTEALARQWSGEQWDVARNCLVGTPIGRGQDAETIAALLDARLVETLAAASEAEAASDADELWPARCAPLFPSLRVDRSILRADPGDALSTLEVLAPRVLAFGPEGALLIAGARERARELAEPIARLDAAMPSGAEYDPARYSREPDGLPPELALESLECPMRAPARRPFLGARAGSEELFDEIETDSRSLRLSGTPDGAPTLAISSAEGTETRQLARDGMRHPLFFDEHTLAWLHAGEARVTFEAIDGSDAPNEPRSVLLDASPFDRLALCRAGDGAHFVGERGEDVLWVRWPGPAGGNGAALVRRTGSSIRAGRREARVPRATSGTSYPSPERSGALVLSARASGTEFRAGLVAVSPRPLARSTIVACDADTLVMAWQDEGAWRGTWCRGERCDALPRLRAGGDLAIAVAGSVLAVARGRRTELVLARTLAPRAEAWSEPVVLARGLLSASHAAFRLEPCAAGAFESRDGRHWEAETPR